MSRGYGLTKYYPFKIIIKKTYQILKPDFAVVQGHKMFLDPKDSLSLSINGVYEKLGTQIVINEIKTGDVVIDIGAHIGYYTLIFAERVGEKGSVFAFEPEPSNFYLLTKNVTANNYHNICLEQTAVSDADGECTLYTFQTSSGANRIYQSTNKKYEKSKPVIVKTTNLDNYFKYHPLKDRINFIKIDVEGAEYKVLKGMENIIKTNNNLKLLMEFNPDYLRNADADPESVLNFLKKENFFIFFIDEKTTNSFLPMNSIF